MKLSLKIPLAFAAAHGSMGEGYRKGFAAFKSADFDPTVGDKAVAGVDREPSALLEQAAKNIAVDSAQVAAKAAIGARHASEISVALMLAVLALDDWWLPIQPHGVAPAWTGPRLRACGRDR